MNLSKEEFVSFSKCYFQKKLHRKDKGNSIAIIDKVDYKADYMQNIRNTLLYFNKFAETFIPNEK